MRIVIVVSGGMVASIITDEPVKVLVLDCDIENADLGNVVSIDGEECYFSFPPVEHDPEKVDDIYSHEEVWEMEVEE